MRRSALRSFGIFGGITAATVLGVVYASVNYNYKGSKRPPMFLGMCLVVWLVFVGDVLVVGFDWLFLTVSLGYDLSFLKKEEK